MLRSSTIWKVAVLVLIGCSYARADMIANESEIALLPPYCKGTQQIREVSHDPVPISQYVDVYGESFMHLHHYCWALNSENKANAMFNKRDHDAKLNGALGDMKYILTNASPDFILLPDIYNSQARMLFELRRDSEAVLSLEKAIELKPGYVPAVARLSDYFVSIGDKEKAIQTLKNGIDNTENANFLISKLAKLGVTYQGTPGSAIKKEEQVKAAPPAASPDAASPSSATPGDAAQPVQATSHPANNPYCRFCP